MASIIGEPMRHYVLIGLEGRRKRPLLTSAASTVFSFSVAVFFRASSAAHRCAGENTRSTPTAACAAPLAVAVAEAEAEDARPSQVR